MKPQKNKELEVVELAFGKALQNIARTTSDSRSTELVHKARKESFQNYSACFFSDAKLEADLKITFYTSVEKAYESDIEQIIVDSKATGFKVNAGGQLEDLLISKLPSSFLDTKSFSQLMSSLFAWSLAVDKMSNLIAKVNFYVMNFSEDLQAKPKKEQYRKIDLRLNSRQIVFVFILRVLRVILNHTKMTSVLGSGAKEALKAFFFIVLTTAISMPALFVKKSIQALAAKMIAPAIMLLLEYIDRFITEKAIAIIDEATVSTYADALTLQLNKSLAFLLKMKVKLEELFSEFMELYFDKSEQFKVSEAKIRMVRIIEAFMLNKDVNFESFDEFLKQNNLAITSLKNGWIVADDLNE